MECNLFGQGYGSMSAPSKEFEKSALSGRIEHFGNPALSWMLANIVIKTDPAGNIKRYLVMRDLNPSYEECYERL